MRQWQCEKPVRCAFVDDDAERLDMAVGRKQLPDSVDTLFPDLRLFDDRYLLKCLRYVVEVE